MIRMVHRGAILLLVAALPLDGQTVRGTLSERGSGVPLEGAVVSLLPPDGDASLAGHITDASGRYALDVPPGRWRLRASLIGHRTVLSEIFELTPGNDLVQDLTSPVEAITLEGISVTAESRRCVVRPGEGLLTARVWEEAKKALENSYWAQERELARFEAVVFERDLHPRTLEVRSERSDRRQGWGERPFTTAPLESLSRGGFVQATDSGTFYFAPDERILLSDEFLEGHCFSVTEGQDAERLGLAFEPVAGGGGVDVRGVLWLDRGTTQLRSLEYRYANLDLGVPSERLGGTVEFQRLPTGLWIIREWRIRMPVIEVQRTRVYAREIERPVLTAIRERGAEIVAVETGGRRLEQLDRPRVHGVVYDSTRGEPLEGAEVLLVGTGQAARSDRGGRWEIVAGEGDFLLAFHHPRLDTLGFQPPPRQVGMRSGVVREVRLAVPSRETIQVQSCTGRGAGPVMVGSVLDRERRPLADAWIGLAWPATDGRLRGLGTRSDREGGFLFCDLPAGAHVLVRAVHEGLTSETMAFALPEVGSLRAELRIDSLETGGVRGEVRDRSSGLPLARVVVRVLGTELETLTAADGSFALDDVPAGSRVLELEHLLYDRQGEALRVAPDSTVDVRVTLATGVIALEPITVTAERGSRMPGAQGFYDRLARGNGYFLTRETIERNQPRQVSDLLNSVPGLTVACGMPSVIGSGCQIRFERARTLGGGECPVQFFLDGTSVAREFVELLRPETIEGIEVYNGLSEVPPQFRRGPDTRCGVIAVWLRERVQL